MLKIIESDVPNVGPPKPYRVLVKLEEANTWVSVWAYEPAEAIFQALVVTAGELGHEGLTVLAVEPDYKEFVRAYRDGVTKEVV